MRYIKRFTYAKASNNVSIKLKEVKFMLRKIRNIFWFPSIKYPNFERVNIKIQNANLTLAIVLSIFATTLITVMYILSFHFDEIKQNRFVYLFYLILSLTNMLLSLTVARKYPWLTTVLIYLSYSLYYMFGILIGPILDPSNKTVTFMVLLVFLPVLFMINPLHIFANTSIYVIIFIICCIFNEEGRILSADITDAIIFGILGSASGCIVNYMKIRGFILEEKLQEISRIDQLTQIRNRNAYEVEVDSIPTLCKHSLACIYIDVNGLHELNNEKGHELGDRMLKYIASEIKYAFTDKYTYRIGGDEFITFIPDKTEEEIQRMIKEMLEKIEAENYHVALGYEIAKIRHLSLDSLIKSAEGKMFRDKKRYYKDIANREIRNIDM